MKKVDKTGLSILAATLFAFMILPAETVKAQLGIGASYEMRDKEPTNGFGLRIQHGILSGIPIVDLGLRAHFSYFSEEVDSYRDFQGPADLDSYDFGLAALGGIHLGLLKPYVGAGLGNESFEAVQQSGGQREFDESSMYWNLFLGAEFSPIPALKPFIEYRFTRLFDDEGFDYNQNGRLAIGITLVF